MRKPLDKRLRDPDADDVRRSHADAITELQDLPMAGARVIRGIVLPAGGPQITVPHKLGRAPAWVGVSAIRWVNGGSIGAGSILDYGTRDPAGHPIDRAQVVVLLNIGFGVDVTVDLLVM